MSIQQNRQTQVGIFARVVELANLIRPHKNSAHFVELADRKSGKTNLLKWEDVLLYRYNLSTLALTLFTLSHFVGPTNDVLSKSRHKFVFI